MQTNSNFGVFKKYQINGTIYMQSQKDISAELKDRLDGCEGELFLCNIPAHMKPEQLIEFASTLGEVYSLRFKIDYDGRTRGYAYLVYENPKLTTKATIELPKLFRSHCVHIFVQRSRNPNILVLRSVMALTPLEVFEKLRKVVKFKKLCVYEMNPNEYVYTIACLNNESAIFVRKALLPHLKSLGPKANIIWLNSLHIRNLDMNDCCVSFDKSLSADTQTLNERFNNITCTCFKF